MLVWHEDKKNQPESICKMLQNFPPKKGQTENDTTTVTITKLHEVQWEKFYFCK